MKYHITRDGKKIKIKDLETSHLINIIRYIERKADEGLEMVYGDIFGADIFAAVETIYGDEVKEELNYEVYVKELNRRKKQKGGLK